MVAEDRPKWNEERMPFGIGKKRKVHVGKHRKRSKHAKSGKHRAR